jgi:4-methyl-5(b-hydroxyethyl)-thiazole monophosphate biosynthesis
MAKRVLVLLAQGCEELEAVTVIDLLRRAGIEVVTAGLDDKPVVASRRTVILPDTSLHTALAGDFDMVVLPGGMPGSQILADDARVIDLVKRMAAAGKFTCAICAAPMVLAKAGVLEGKRATCYPGVLEGLGLKPTGEAVCRDGNAITSRGPGTAMDFALALIEALDDKTARDKVEQSLVR